MKRYFSNLNFTAGFIFTAIVVIVGLTSLVWTPYEPNEMSPRERLQPPSAEHLLGTDFYGRDVASRVMVGAVNSIIVGLVTVAIGLTIGVVLGLLAAYRGGWAEEGIMRLADLLFAFPAILTAVLLKSIVNQEYFPPILISMIAIGVFYIPVFARVTRAVTLSVLEREFITAARACGKKELSIAWRHVLPNILSPLIIQGTIQFAVSILVEAALSYLGFGVRPPHASWGMMLKEAQTYMELAPWLAIFPGVAIAWAVLGFNLIGDGLRDTLDPKMVRVR